MWRLPQGVSSEVGFFCFPLNGHHFPLRMASALRSLRIGGLGLPVRAPANLLDEPMACSCLGAAVELRDNQDAGSWLI